MKQLILSALLSASALADDGATRFVADQALALARDNYNTIHNIANGSNNCYSAYAVSQAYYNANYYGAQIEASTAAMQRDNERICRYLRGGR